MIYAHIYPKDKSHAIGFYGDDPEIAVLPEMEENGIEEKSPADAWDYLAENGFTPVSKDFFFKS